jgi:exopolysaccharide biosynthesis polyprenyl glycosylphosphotransferase
VNSKAYNLGHGWLLLWDTLALSAGWCALLLLRSQIVVGGLPPLPAPLLLPLGALVIPLWMLPVWAAGPRARPAALLRAIGLGLVSTLAVLWLAHVPVNRTVLLGFTALSAPLLLANRAAWRAWCGEEGLRVWVVGEPASTDTLAAHLRRHGARIAGRAAPEQVPELQALLQQEPADEVMVAGLLPMELLAKIAQICEERATPLTLDASFVGLRTTQATLGEVGGWATITVRAASERDLSRLLKRALDLAGALGGLLLAAPLLALLLWAIRRQDGHPALLRQTRVGRYGRPFTMYKLRTMIPGSDGAPDEGDWRPEGGYKRWDDPRVTPIGRALRRLSLDELPQLVNVLRGEMSLVGPRPPLPYEVERYERWQCRRLSVLPGMTGLWQVSGRADLPFDRWIVLDLQYVDSWSLWLDVKLLLQTVPAVLTGTGAR